MGILTAATDTKSTSYLGSPGIPLSHKLSCTVDTGLGICPPSKTFDRSLQGCVNGSWTRIMASATITKPLPPPPPPPPSAQQPSQPLTTQSQPNGTDHRLSFSSSSQGNAAELNQSAPSSRHPLPTASAAVNPRASFDHYMSQPPPPQFSSQHSFSMSQVSSQPARPAGYHQFANSQPNHVEEDALPQIYSVRSALLPETMHPSRIINPILSLVGVQWCRGLRDGG